MVSRIFLIYSYPQKLGKWTIWLILIFFKWVESANYTNKIWVSDNSCEDVTFLSDGALRSDPKINDWKGDLHIENVDLPIPPCHMGGLWKVFTDASGRITIIPTPQLSHHTLAVSSWPHFQAKAWHLLPTPWDRHHVLTLLILHRIVEWTKPCGAPRAAITRIASSLVSLCGGSSSRSRLTSRIALLALRLK